MYVPTGLVSAGPARRQLQASIRRVRQATIPETDGAAEASRGSEEEPDPGPLVSCLFGALLALFVVCGVVHESLDCVPAFGGRSNVDTECGTA